MGKKWIAVLVVLILLSVGYDHFFSDREAASGEAPVSQNTGISSGPQQVSGLYGVYAELDDITGTGCRVIISGDPTYELSSVFTLFEENGSEFIPLTEFAQTDTVIISQSGTVADINWAERYGSLPKGEYCIQLTLIEGYGSVTFQQDFEIR